MEVPGRKGPLCFQRSVLCPVPNCLGTATLWLSVSSPPSYVPSDTGHRGLRESFLDTQIPVFPPEKHGKGAMCGLG